MSFFIQNAPEVLCHDRTLVATIVYWLLASVATLGLRRLSAQFASLVGYGGRAPKAVKLKGATGTDEASFLTQLFGRLHGVKMSRKSAFVSFYIVAVLGGSLNVALGYSHPGLWIHLLFLIHCLRRLLETLFVQEFRPQGDDVTLIAATAGASFYVAAPLSILLGTSCASIRFGDSDGAPLGTSAGYFAKALTSAAGAIIGVYCGVVHVVFQCIQYHHHCLLAKHRQEQQQRRRRARTAEDFSKLKPYTLPKGVGLFDTIQEPHYFCEVVLYLAIAIACSYGVRFMPRVYSSDGLMFYLSRFPVWLVPVFTTVNLGVTATEKRAYWESVAEKPLPPYLLLYKLY